MVVVPAAGRNASGHQREAAEEETGLPAGDPVRFGAENLTAALLAD